MMALCRRLPSETLTDHTGAQEGARRASMRIPSSLFSHKANAAVVHRTSTRLVEA